MTTFTIPAPDKDAYAAARTRLDGLVKPVGALGRLEDLAAWLSAAHGCVPPRELADVRVVVFAGDHGVTHSAVSAAKSLAIDASVSRGCPCSLSRAA